LLFHVCDFAGHSLPRKRIEESCSSNWLLLNLGLYIFARKCAFLLSCSGGMLLNCQSLRKFQHSGGWIKSLLKEVENERMHLMRFMEVEKPKWYERTLVFTVQGVFFNVYTHIHTYSQSNLPECNSILDFRIFHVTQSITRHCFQVLVQSV